MIIGAAFKFCANMFLKQFITIVILNDIKIFIKIIPLIVLRHLKFVQKNIREINCNINLNTLTKIAQKETCTEM